MTRPGGQRATDLMRNSKGKIVSKAMDKATLKRQASGNDFFGCTNELRGKWTKGGKVGLPEDFNYEGKSGTFFYKWEAGKIGGTPICRKAGSARPDKMTCGKSTTIHSVPAAAAPAASKAAAVPPTTPLRPV